MVDSPQFPHFQNKSRQEARIPNGMGHPLPNPVPVPSWSGLMDHHTAGKPRFRETQMILGRKQVDHRVTTSKHPSNH